MLNQAKNDLVIRYRKLIERLRSAEHRFGRTEGSVCLVAVSKTYPAQDIRSVAGEGQRDFGENQVQDALGKIPILQQFGCTWHFIGPIQSNKCRDIAQNFDWVHSVDRLKIARRLSELRPASMAPLNIMLQVNLQNESNKAGISPNAVSELANAVGQLSNIRLRGLMVIPLPEGNFERQRLAFASLRELRTTVNGELGTNMDYLSMGMTNDLEAAVAEGTTHVRIGTAIFGPRQRRYSEGT
jgi:pyridoxal phosphate enzyme (YggS family)